MGSKKPGYINMATTIERAGGLSNGGGSPVETHHNDGFKAENQKPDELMILTDALNHLYFEYSTAHLTDPKKIAERDEATEAWNKTFAKGSLYYFAEDPRNPEKKKIKRLPMHGLLSWADDRLKDPTLTEEQRKAYGNNKRILEKYSKSTEENGTIKIELIAPRQKRASRKNNSAHVVLVSEQIRQEPLILWDATELERLSDDGNGSRIPEGQLSFDDLKTERVIVSTEDEWLKGPIPAEPRPEDLIQAVLEPTRKELNNLKPEQPEDKSKPGMHKRLMDFIRKIRKKELLRPDSGLKDSGHTREATMTPQTEQRKETYTIVFAPLDPAYKQEAQRWAEHQLQIDLAPGNGLRERIGRIRGIVATRLTEEGRRQNYIEQAKKLLLKANNPYAKIDLATNVVIDRSFQYQEYKDAQLATVKVIEINPSHFATAIPQLDERFKETVKREISYYAFAGLTETQMRSRFREFIRNNKQQLGKIFDNMDISDEFIYGFASNILEKVAQIRRTVASGRIASDQIDLNIQFAIPHWGTETQPELKRRDKWIAGVQKRRPTGWMSNPAILGGTMAAATNSAVAATNWGARTALPIVGILPAAITGGWLAKARRSYDLKRDLATQRIDNAVSDDPIQPKSRRRNEISRFTYHTRTSSQLLNGITSGGSGDPFISKDSGLYELMKVYVENPSEAAFKLIAKKRAEILSRLLFSQANQVDLIRYKSKYTIQQERNLLNKGIVDSYALLSNLGIRDETIQAATRDYLDEWRNLLSDHKQKIDRTFNSYRTMQARNAFVEGAAKGAGAGIVAGLGINALGWLWNDVLHPLIPSSGGITTGATDEVLKTTKDVTIQPIVAPADHVVFDAPKPEKPDNTSFLVRDLNSSQDTQSVIFQEAGQYKSTLDGKPIEIPDGTVWKLDVANGRHDLVLQSDTNKVLVNNAYWEDGRLHADPNSLWNPKDHIVDSQPRRAITEKVLGKHGIWRNEATSIDGKIWDTNGTSGVYDGTELEFRNFKRGNAVGFRLPKGAKGIFLTLDGHPNPIYVPGKDGVVILDPDSKRFGKIAQMVIDQDELSKYKNGGISTEIHPKRRAILRVKRIEAGSLVEKHGERIAKIKATILGSGEMPDQIQTGKTAKTFAKILPGEIPAEPTPTPTPAPTQSPTAKPTFEITPPPTQIPLESPSDSPPPILSNSGTSEVNIDIVETGRTVYDSTPKAVIPFASRYPLEPIEKTYRTSTDHAPVPHTSPKFIAQRQGLLENMNPNNYLTQEQQFEIDKLRNKGFSFGQIANKLGINPVLVVHYEIWKRRLNQNRKV